MSDVKEIKLTKGQAAIVDAADYDMLMQYRWYAYQSKSGKWYTATSKRNMKTTGMHQIIMGCQSPQVCDYRNGNALDNRRDNLRVTDYSGNSCNVGLKANNTTGFKGIKKCKNDRWEAGIKVKGKTIYLGSFPAPELAAYAYDQAAIEHFGDMAKTNAAGVNYHAD